MVRLGDHCSRWFFLVPIQETGVQWRIGVFESNLNLFSHRNAYICIGVVLIRIMYIAV